jgi:hypothetical protein
MWCAGLRLFMIYFPYASAAAASPAAYETEAAGWSGRLVYVRVPDRRYRLTSVWLNAADVTRR